MRRGPPPGLENRAMTTPQARLRTTSQAIKGRDELCGPRSGRSRSPHHPGGVARHHARQLSDDEVLKVITGRRRSGGAAEAFAQAS